MTKWREIKEIVSQNAVDMENLVGNYLNVHYGDVVSERRKIPELGLYEERHCVECGGDYDDLYCATECFGIGDLGNMLGSSLWGVTQVVYFYDLLFIKIDENSWSVHYKYTEDNVKWFETLDFTPFIKIDKFEELIEALLEGPESYWGVEQYIESKKTVIDTLIKLHLSEKSEERSKRLKMLTSSSLNSIEIEDDDLPI